MTLRLPSRRLLLAGAGTLLLSGRAAHADVLAPTPAQTEGPFYPVSFPADLDNDLVQVRGQAARAMGTVLHLTGRVLGRDGKPAPGALVEIWQSDSHGIYDHPRQSGRDKRDPAFQGYGRMMADASGSYSFRTLKPVAYPGRTPHIHFAVLEGGKRRVVSQMFIEGEPGNERDFIYRNLGREARLVTMKVSGDAKGLAGSLDVVLA
jgi:protocatechuate 3,4-dioxygenase beta subunit